ncbi:hypothetical protein P7K49_027408 [Saguinus oedipus]|uniref:Uncharacterized protein n=1 Tax=Saguinus oedipus TaxID=9490 RepID=A0ABQ9UA70_SAGOE|nr:hypothetical protein P7K49_027408 [Saguinus oedipus]
MLQLHKINVDGSKVTQQSTGHHQPLKHSSPQTSQARHHPQPPVWPWAGVQFDAELEEMFVEHFSGCLAQAGRGALCSMAQAIGTQPGSSSCTQVLHQLLQEAQRPS